MVGSLKSLFSLLHNLNYVQVQILKNKMQNVVIIPDDFFQINDIWVAKLHKTFDFSQTDARVPSIELLGVRLDFFGFVNYL